MFDADEHATNRWHNRQADLHRGTPARVAQIEAERRNHIAAIRERKGTVDHENPA